MEAKAVAPKLVADRYRLDVHLGRDHDIDQWLGTDTLLDRPVLIRALDKSADETRREAFLGAVRRAAAVSHVHLAAVFVADFLAGRAYAVQEWAGGVTLADRIAAGELMAPESVLPNAAGLAEALAALHASGGAHGGIDAAAIMYPAVSPAKLDGFGRSAAPADPAADVADLARALRRAIGSDDADESHGPGLPPGAARALDRAAAGEGDAASLAAALRASPPPQRHKRREWSWTWVSVAAAILVAATLVGIVGVALRVRPTRSPLLFPATPGPSAQPATPSGTAATPDPGGGPSTPTAPPVLLTAAAYDPFGTGGERDRDVPLLHDGDEATSWRTERYFDPLERIKPGVGVTFSLEGTPTRLTVTASDGTAFRIAWAPRPPGDFDGWQQVAAGRIDDTRTTIDLPPRRGGTWLLWLTELPEQPPDGHYFSHVSEVRFER